MSPIVQSIDQSLWFIIIVDIFLLAGITATMLCFVFRYSRKKNRKPEQIEGSLKLEIIWTVIPTIIVMIMFYLGYRGYIGRTKIPDDAIAVKVIARKWSWEFQYPNGKSSDTLVVPVGKNIALDIVSEDVVHSFYAPDFRLKMDAMPGRTNKTWFLPTYEGTYDIFCAEYCGTLHAGMLAKMLTVAPEKYAAWLEAVPTVGRGEAVFKQICSACHSLDGKPGVGPTFKGIWSRKERVVTDGKEREIIVDEAYLRTSIIEPAKDITKGFQNVMPPQKMTDEDLEALIEYIKEL